MSQTLLEIGLFIYIVLSVTNISESRYHTFAIDICIIGGGPAGLQLAYFFHKRNRDYVVFERGSQPGTFFKTYPRHDLLISINKMHTGSNNTEFNMRHDWNSLLSNPDEDAVLLFSEFSREYFPQRKDLLRYMRDFVRLHELRVRFNTEIMIMGRSSMPSFSYEMKDQHHNTYLCRNVVLATGLHTPHIPQFGGVELATTYAEMILNPKHYEGKRVLIIGKGNTAMEVAKSLYGVTSTVFVASRSRSRLSWETHYVGDIRGINNEMLDSYQLKSLDALDEIDVERIRLQNTTDGRIKLVSDHHSPYPDSRYTCDEVILCTGWKFDDSFINKSIPIIMGSGRLAKYPQIRSDYGLVGHKNIYVAGTLAHSLDYRKSAGGFIHGFRYTARALYRFLEWRVYSQKWPHIIGEITDLLNHIIRRINEASGPYQMFSTLGDVILLHRNKTSYAYLEEYPLKDLPNLSENTGHSTDSGIIVFTFEYGRHYSGPGKDVFYAGRQTSDPTQAYKSNFLHPVIYYYDNLPNETSMQNKKEWHTLPRPDRLLHMVEDLETKFDNRRLHIIPLLHFLETVTGHFLTDVDAEDCMVYHMADGSTPMGCRGKQTGGDVYAKHAFDSEALGEFAQYLLPTREDQTARDTFFHMLQHGKTVRK